MPFYPGIVASVGVGGGAAAFPTWSRTTQPFSTAGTTHNVNMPATVNAGDLIIVAVASRRSGQVISSPGGSWVALAASQEVSAALTYGIWALDAAGTEDGTTAAFTLSQSAGAVAHVFRIQGWAGTIADDVDISTHTAAALNTVNPNGVTAGWGIAKNLFIEFAFAGDDGVVCTAASSNYTDLASVENAVGSNFDNSLGSAVRELEAGSDDPGNMTFASAQQLAARTLVVRPA